MMKFWATLVVIIFFLFKATLVYAGHPHFRTTYKLNVSQQGHPAALLELPRRYYQKEKWPLIVNVHGYTSSIFMQYMFTRLSFYKDVLGFMILTPEGRKDIEGEHYWNGGNFCCDFYKSGVDDTLYIKNLIDYIANDPRFNRVDMSRIYFFGHSNGGFFSYKMACTYPNYVTAVGVLGATLDLRDENGEVIIEQDPCPNVKAVPIFHIHGTKDKTIPFVGKDYYPEHPFGHIGAQEAVDKWIYHNRCNNQSDESRTNATWFVRGKETTIKTYGDCEDDAVIKFAVVKKGQHKEFLRLYFYRKMLKFFLKFSNVEAQ
uniref:alpha/beta hydrolase family esterase n=2 Tax=Halobacteriovorax TaxID=1652133 RepID=UPI00371D8F9A